MTDSKFLNLILKEFDRQNNCLNMIASENIASYEVMNASGSCLMNKYAEGYPRKRYYQGNSVMDEIEQLAIDRAKKLFNAEHANVQPHSGSPANEAVYRAFLQPKNKVLSMSLSSGGHLTHGSDVNFSGQDYKFFHYDVDRETELINYDIIEEKANKIMPRMILSGFTAYPREVNYKKIAKIADNIGAVSFADISHTAGLIAANLLESPLPQTDIVMTTTHKTLRGCRGAIILCKNKFKEQINKAVFPGLQGGAHFNNIAAKAVCFHEASHSSFKSYSKQVMLNAKILADELMDYNIKLVSDGTDTHLILIDLKTTLRKEGLGRQVAEALESVKIVTNANPIPFDTSTPWKPSGLRLGTPFLTSQGYNSDDMRIIANFINNIIHNYNSKNVIKKVRNEVNSLVRKANRKKQTNNLLAI